MHLRIRVGSLILVSFTTALCMLGSKGALAQNSVAELTARIVEIRDKTQSYVSIAKGSLQKQDLIDAQKLYAETFSKCNGWNAYLTTALRDGKTRISSLKDDPDYKKHSADATASASAFLTYVDSKTTQSKAVMPIVSALADLGFKLWTQIADRKAQERKTASDAFAVATKWSEWADIKAN